LFPRLCAALAGTSHRVFLLGARPEVVAGVRDWIAQHHPSVTVCGSRDGYFNAAEEPQVIADIAAARADLLLVALGAPHQEKWIARCLAATGVKLAIGVGGLFDFYSGRIPRAPQWLRELGGEWLYRLYQEPRRMWRRYLVGNVVFLWRVIRERQRRHPIGGYQTEI
jgi:N-acetylglucosaminyldiphosphoundecaprenol N-acetyl-beta-D-mannosaminyltransferase